MQPKSKFWVDFFNYLFRVVTFKKIIPQPRKTKRKNYHVALSRMHITSIMCNVENAQSKLDSKFARGNRLLRLKNAWFSISSIMSQPLILIIFCILMFVLGRIIV